MLLSAVPIFIVVLGASKAAETRLVDFPYHANLDLNGVFQLFWKFDNDTITFHYQALSKGWAGIGFSPSGAMTGADIVVLWVDPSGKGMISVGYTGICGGRGAGGEGLHGAKGLEPPAGVESKTLCQGYLLPWHLDPTTGSGQIPS